MTRVILKPSRDADLYAVYSENTDAILFAGDRDAVERWLGADACHPADGAPVVVKGRLARADEYGSSSRIPLGRGDGVLYGWDDEALRISEGVGGPGTLPRGALFPYCGYLMVGDEERAAACVLPDDDEDE